MLRVGLTGSLGSGKSTVAAMLRELGAHVIEADELGRRLMEPGEQVYGEIVRVFGPGVVAADGRLDRPALAVLAFGEDGARGRLDELNAIVHPAVIEAQREWADALFARNPRAVAVVESALIFEVERDARRSHPSRDETAPWMGHSDVVGHADEVRHADEMGPDPAQELLANWRNRFDRIMVLTAPDDVKVKRYVDRVTPADRRNDAAWRQAAEADARVRLARQIPDAEKAARADFVISNGDGLEPLRAQVAAVWEQLRAESNIRGNAGSLE